MLPDLVNDNQIKIQSRLSEPSSTCCMLRCWCLLAAFFMALGLNLSLGTTDFKSKKN